MLQSNKTKPNLPGWISPPLRGHKKNINSHSSMQTKLKQLWHVAIQQQVCAGLTAAGTPAALPPSAPFWDNPTQQETVAIAAGASAKWRNTDMPSASAKSRVS